MMYFEKIPLRKYNNIFQGETAVIVGTGPTNFDYKDLQLLKFPTFLLNDSINFEKFTCNPSFFYTSAFNPMHQPQSKNNDWYKLINKSICLVKHCKIRPNGTFQCLNLMPYTYYTLFDLIYNTTLEDVKINQLSVIETGFPKWCYDKDYIIRNNCLFSHQGSITALIHFLWFCGINKSILIGCGPTLHYSHDQRILNLNGGRQPAWDLPIILKNQTKFLQYFKIQPEYLGI